MTWYDKSFKRRQPLMIDSALTGSGPIQIQLQVPTTWDDFWENIRSDGFDMVLTDQSGSFLPFERVSFNYANRTVTLRANYGTVKAANVMHVIFVYWDNPDQTSDLSSSVGASSPLLAHAYLGAPFKFIVTPDGARGLTTTPTTIVQKDPDEKIDVWFPISQLLAPRTTPHNERLDFKSIEYVNAEVLDNSGVNQAGMYALRETRIINGWIKLRIQSGVDANDYVIRALIHTTDLELYILTCLLQVRKLLPS